jgi:SPP1 gp7 family putative phage head morphogenesis protein
MLLSPYRQVQKAQFSDRNAPSADWRALHRIADSVYRSVQLRVLRALRSVTIDMTAAEGYLSVGNINGAANAVDVEPLAKALVSSSMPALKTIYARSTQLAMQRVARGTAIRVAKINTIRATRVAKLTTIDEESFRQTNPFAERWAAEKTGALITEITNETRSAVQVFIGRAFSEQIPPRQIARQLRSVIGLTSRQAGAVAARIAQGASPAQANRYAAQLLNQRAELIARTEIMSASNAGQLDAWRAAQRDGMISSVLVREFIVTPDDRLCPVCEPLDGEQAAMGDTFSFGGMYPPVHPACRCAVGLVDPKSNG